MFNQIDFLVPYIVPYVVPHNFICLATKKQLIAYDTSLSQKTVIYWPPLWWKAKKINKAPTTKIKGEARLFFSPYVEHFFPIPKMHFLGIGNEKIRKKIKKLQKTKKYQVSFTKKEIIIQPTTSLYNRVSICTSYTVSIIQFINVFFLYLQYVFIPYHIVPSFYFYSMSKYM